MLTAVARPTARVRLALAVACLLAPLGAVPTLAQEAGLAPGAGALVANTDGDGVVLREGPGYDARVLAGFPEGTPVAITDGPIYAEDGSVWYGVTVGDQDGYIVSNYLAPAAPGVAAAPADTLAAGRSGEAFTSAAPGGVTITADGPTVTDTAAGTTTAPAAAPPATEGAAAQPTTDIIADPAAAPAGATAAATQLVNLRAGPGEGYDVLRVLPAGAEVTVTGESANGWTPVWYNGTDGYIVDDYLRAGAAEAAQPVPGRGARTGTATVIDAAELKADPAATSLTLAWLPVGTTFTPTAGPEQGFYQTTWEGQTGWVSGAFLSFDQAPTNPQPAASPPGDAAAGATPTGEEAAPAATGLAWPVTGGTWYVMQGYFGASHQNRDELWQYAYSLDLARRDGESAGAPVLAPAAGTVRWTDPGSGGISIDIGNGHAVALFHVTLDGSLRAGRPLAPGDFLGTVSGPGGMGYSSSPHVQITLWATNDGGNWDRRAVPFTGAYAIAGQEFPDVGGSQQHRGFEFTP